MADYCTLEQVKNYLHIGSNSDDALLAGLISTASALIDDRCGRFFSAQVGTRYYDAIGPHVAGHMLLLDEDLLSVTQIVNGDGSLVPIDKVMLRPINRLPYFGISIRQESGIRWTYDDNPEGAIAVTGTWGHSASPPPAVQHATMRLTVWLYRQRDMGGEAIDLEVSERGVSVAPARLPQDVMDILHPFVRFRMRASA